jgi:hypothetical protein
MTLGACPRRERDLLAPFEGTGEFAGLTVERVKTVVALDSAWADYERDGDGEALAAKRALFFRVIFVPTLSQALSPTRSATHQRVFADRLDDLVRRRIARAPARLDHLVGIIVVAKREAA